MKIQEYIKAHFLNRLDLHECLVVYDPDQKYRGVVLDIESERCVAADGSVGTIRTREKAMETWTGIGREPKGASQLLVYVPTRKPTVEEELQRDPYQVFAIGGAVFPDTDADSYLELCIGAKPEHEEKVRALFASDPSPSFDTIDALDSGSTWPKLRSLLGVESNREIVVALLSPSTLQRTNLESDEAWQAEYREFTSSVLGWRSNGRLKKWESIRDELARFVLFSEFVFDLQSDLPEALEQVPHADQARKKLVYNVCDTLRTSQHHQDDYIRIANQVTEELHLEQHTSGLEYGVLDTFQFEERAFLRRFVKKAMDGNLSESREILEQRRDSIWAHTEERGIAWLIAERALDLIEEVGKRSGQIAHRSTSLAECVDFYAKDARRVDTLHRGFEQTVQSAYGMTEELDSFIEQARHKHRSFIDQLQKEFIRLVKTEGWPVGGLLRHTQVFDTFIAPVLAEHGRKIALIMVDAFRYELAAEFANKLSKDADVELSAVASYLPTLTPVGMAALMPEADGILSLVKQGDTLVPSINGKKISVPRERLDYVQDKYGDRCAMLYLDDLFNRRKRKLKDTVQFLLVTTTEIDTAGEAMKVGVQQIIEDVQEKFLRIVKILQEMGFERIIFATDHGFILLGELTPGDKVEKPSGNWLLSKDRCLLGSGSVASGSTSFDKEEVGIKGEFDQIVVPETFGAYRTGSTYMHQGISLQECVLPVVAIDIRSKKEQHKTGVDLRLLYKAGTTEYITSRRPVIEIALFAADMFGPEELEFRLEARAKNKAVGEAAPNSYMDPSTGLIKITTGSAIKVPLKMAEGYEGAFTVMAFNPITQVTYATLELKTDYVD